MNERLIFKEKFYMEATAKLAEACAKAEQLSSDKRFAKEFIMSEINKMVTEINAMMIIGFDFTKSRIEKRNKEIRREYEKQVHYFDDDIFIEPLPENATSVEQNIYKEKVEKAQSKRIKQAQIKQAELTAEIIQRQDFDMKLELMEDHDLEKFIGEITNEETAVNNYELAKIRLRVKSMPESKNKKDLAEILNTLAVTNGVDNPWLKDAEFIRNKELLRDLSVFPTDAIFVFDNEHQDYEAKMIDHTIFEATEIPDIDWSKYKAKAK